VGNGVEESAIDGVTRTSVASQGVEVEAAGTEVALFVEQEVPIKLIKASIPTGKIYLRFIIT
jgi:hypothetical protein